MFGGAGHQVHGLGGGATIVAMVDVQKLSAELWILWGAPQSGGGTGRGEVPLLKFEKPCNIPGCWPFNEMFDLYNYFKQSPIQVLTSEIN